MLGFSKKPTLRTRKPADKLTRLDFATFSIWEYVFDEVQYDETFVKPVRGETIPSDSHLHISAQFTTPLGTVYDGFIEINTLEPEPAFRNQTIFFGEKCIELTPPGGEIYCRVENATQVHEMYDRDYKHYVSQFEKTIKCPLESIFPLKWRLQLNNTPNDRETTGILAFPAPLGYQPKVVEPSQWLKDTFSNLMKKNT